MKFLDYIQGLRKGKDAHRIEHDAMSDPFLSDAIDGYDSVKGNHRDRIAEMQSRISGRTTLMRKRSGAWKIAVAAVAVIALLGGYFALMNHDSAMIVAREADNSYITIYAPEDYVDRRNLELAELKEAGKSTDVQVNAVVDIVNLHEVIRPVERIKIYMPEVYYAQLNQKEREELSAEKNLAPVSERMYAESTVDMSASKASESTVLYAEKVMAEPVSPQVASVATGDDFYFARRSSGGELKGKIVDERNEPLIGANVAVKGTNESAVTDMDGNYRLFVDSAVDADLIAQYIGYETIEIPKAKDNQVIAMKESRQQLDEVAVTGYGTQKKRSTTGAVSKVSADAMMDRVPASPVEKASEEKVAAANRVTADYAKQEKAGEVIPGPVGGDKAYRKYLEDNLVRPAGDAVCKKGNVVVEFNVNTSGRPVNVKVIKGICEPFDREAVRLVETGPDWTYGTARAKVEVKF